MRFSKLIITLYRTVLQWTVTMKAKMLAVILIILGMFVLQDVDAFFGCPNNMYRCIMHCQRIGCRSGYCDLRTFDRRCTCVACRHYDDMEVMTDE
ncbi:hemocyte defensin Cg-Defh1-like [Mercenaria mercenaria]|uniref:hemocyte defensin Cg-Defh1-like n=1 Tax=Mercenaria mercenaria TaxID=6596 RepID=UPI00234F197A|nr:hemocyte defensin Cg-Defh1-like [Mercenaria mercenaria]